MPESIRIGLIGCGAVVRTCHLPALRELPGVTVTAVVDADTGRAAAAAQQVAGFQPADPPLVATSLAAALPRIDAALVCTSHASHASITATLLRAGKHVLVEKPLATTVADCDMLSGLREAGGLVLAVGHVRRLFPMALWISQLLTTGALGQPRSVLWKEGQSFEWPVMSASMFQADTACGGVVLDTGVHVLDLLMMWFGDDVTITGYRDDFAGGIESEADISLQIGAVTADVLLSRQRSLGNYCEITGSAATVRVGIFGFGLDYQIRHHPGEVTTGTVPQPPRRGPGSTRASSRRSPAPSGPPQPRWLMTARAAARSRWRGSATKPPGAAAGFRAGRSTPGPRRTWPAGASPSPAPRASSAPGWSRRSAARRTPACWRSPATTAT
jgi:predicted dehydrogenase